MLLLFVWDPTISIHSTLGPSSPLRGRGILVEEWNSGGDTYYFQSIRPSENRMYVNIDIATGIMYRSGPLIDLFSSKGSPVHFRLSAVLVTESGFACKSSRVMMHEHPYRSRPCCCYQEVEQHWRQLTTRASR